MSEESIIDIRSAVRSEIQNQIKNLFGNELSPKAKELIITCPQLINRLAAKLDRSIENLTNDESALEPIVIQHVEYSLDECGRNQ